MCRKNRKSGTVLDDILVKSNKIPINMRSGEEKRPGSPEHEPNG